MVGKFQTGVPEGDELPPAPVAPAALVAPAAQAAAAVVKTENQQGYCGVKYDEVHSLTVKNINQVIQQ